MIEKLLEWDATILIYLNSFHSLFFYNIMLLITEKVVWIPFYVALSYFVISKKGLEKGIIWLLAIGIIILVTDQVTGSLIRPLVGRLRPMDPSNPHSDFILLAGDYRAQGLSFPSCHAANSFALATIICLLFNRNLYIKLLVIIWALLHSFSRIYLCAHYLGDIICGAIVGTTVSLLVFLIFSYLLKRIPGVSDSYRINSEKRKPYAKPPTSINFVKNGNLSLVYNRPEIYPIGVFVATLLVIVIHSSL